MLRAAAYFKQPVEAIFQWVDELKAKDKQPMPSSQSGEHLLEQPSARPAETELFKDKSLVGPTAKDVASLSRSKPKQKQ